MIEIQMAKTAKMTMENVCILTDIERPESITKVLAIAAQMVGAETAIVTMTSRDMSGVELSHIAAAARRAADAIINQTSFFLHIPRY